MARTFLALFTIALLATTSAPAQQPASPAPLQIPHPHYNKLTLTIDINAPVDKVWTRVGKYCDLGEWGIPGCTIVSGDGGLGTIRAVNSTTLEILVAQTQYSYTYTQPVREGIPYNLYHATIEAIPLTPATTQVRYEFVYDNSMLADDAAREKETANRKARFGKMLENMKVLAEGGTLPPGALSAPGNAPAPAH